MDLGPDKLLQVEAEDTKARSALSLEGRDVQTSDAAGGSTSEAADAYTKARSRFDYICGCSPSNVQYTYAAWCGRKGSETRPQSFRHLAPVLVLRGDVARTNLSASSLSAS